MLIGGDTPRLHRIEIVSSLSPDLLRESPHRDDRNIEFVGLDERDEAVRAEGVRHLELPGGEGAHIAPSRPDHVDGTRFTRARFHAPFDPQGSPSQVTRTAATTGTSG